MGMVFGKQTVAEPAFDSLLSRTKHVEHVSYELRKYGERFAAEVKYVDADDMNSPFRSLAQYIGVFGSPQNEGNEAISMTAPVVIEGGNGGGTPIAMTAPVVTEKTDDGMKTMKFMLPAEYDSMEKIPKPTNPQVYIETIPSQVGAVHVYNGNMDEDHNREMAIELAEQLIADGVPDISVDYVLEHYSFFGYNPPFTIPFFRRNEVWVELTDAQVDHLLNKFKPDASN